MVPGLENGDEMDDYDDTPPSPGRASNSRSSINLARACDYCRQRKAGCSREKPTCRNCKNAKRQCTYTDPVLRKENPTMKLSGQLSSLGSRLSRIESLLPAVTQGSPSQGSPFSGEETSRRLHGIETRIGGIEDKLDSVLSLLSALNSVKSNHGTPPGLSLDDRLRKKRNSMTGHGDEDDSQGGAPAGEPLVADEQGNVYYLGRSSNYSFTADAEILVQARLKSSKASTASKHGSLHSSSNPESQVWDAEENIEGEEEAKILSGMASHLGDMRGEGLGSRERTVPRELGLSNELIEENGYLGHMGKRSKTGADEEFYIPTLAEGNLILERVYRKGAPGIPLIYRMPPKEVIRRLLFSPQECIEDETIDSASVTIANCLGYYVLALDLTGTSPQEYQAELKLKRRMAKNAWASFKDLRIFLTPGIPHVQALMMMGIIAQDTSRPGLCWMLICQACRLAQAMGLHRRIDPERTANLSSDDITNRISLFWMLYVLDKSFSLSFGRTSCFQDFDCDVELPPTTDKPFLNGSVSNCFEPNHFRAMVEMARLQSLVYKKLYSVKGSSRKGIPGMEETEKTVWELDAKLRALRDSPVFNIATLTFVSLSPDAQKINEDILIAAENLVFAYHTLMTMIHRRIYNPTKNNQGEGDDSRFRSRNILLLSARSAIQIVRKLGVTYKNYVKTRWLILFHPFAPFFVLFSKIVTCPNSPTNEVDIQLMCFVENFLEDVRDAAYIEDDGNNENDENEGGDGIKKLLTVVKAFIRVAKSFIRRDKERLQGSTIPNAESEHREVGGPSDEEVQMASAAGDGSPHHPRPNENEQTTSEPPPILLTNIFSPLAAVGENSLASGNPASTDPVVVQRSIDFLNLSAESYRQYQQMQLNAISNLPPADDNEGGFVRWNTTVPTLSMNNLQDLASMDIDMTSDMPISFDYNNQAFPTPTSTATGYIGQPTQGLAPGSVEFGNIDYAVATSSASCASGARPRVTVDNDFMAVFECGVRQGAMDFDWINWEA
ncbi:fungal-specific transcription factor domain-containing protein [Peziza echinospora]|nr:fungal-specific transcription factor domain-containing protein [Peziza echinospora]